MNNLVNSFWTRLRQSVLVTAVCLLVMTTVSACGSAMASSVAGDWSGPLVLEGADPAGTLYITLIDTSAENAGESDFNLEGTARFCLDGQTGIFDLIGEIDNDGNIVDLRFRATEDTFVWRYFPQDGRLDGDTLTLSGLYNYDPTGRFIISSADPETFATVALVRSDVAAAGAVCPG